MEGCLLHQGSVLPSMAVLDLDRLQVKTPGRRLYCYNFLVTLRGKFWNTLWPDLVQMSKRLKELGISPSKKL